MDTLSSHSTSVSYNVSVASDHDESNFLKRIRSLGYARLGLALICFGIALAIIGCEAVPLQHYHHTSAYGQVWLNLWPLNFDLRPTIAILSCGGVIALQSLIYIVSALLPSPHSRIRHLNLLAAATAFCGFITALVGVVFSVYLPRSTYPNGFSQNETLHSWTCKWKAIENASSDNSTTASVQAPAYFERDCTETEAAFVLLGILIGLEVLMGAVAAAGFWLERGVSRQRTLELEKVQVIPKHPERV